MATNRIPSFPLKRQKGAFQTRRFMHLPALQSEDCNACLRNRTIPNQQ